LTAKIDQCSESTIARCSSLSANSKQIFHTEHSSRWRDWHSFRRHPLVRLIHQDQRRPHCGHHDMSNRYIRIVFCFYIYFLPLKEGAKNTCTWRQSSCHGEQRRGVRTEKDETGYFYFRSSSVL